MLKENVRSFTKNCQLTSYAIIFGQITLFYKNLFFREKQEFYLFSNKVIFKDCVLFKYTVEH